MLVKPGQILMGKYRFERIIGRGGIGLVAKAHHLHLNETVAIKFLLPKAAKDEEVVKRFIREGQAAVKLKSEHVCRVLDVGMMDNGSPYMVMEYMAGTDLRRLLKSHNKIHPNAAVDFILQACAALGEAHSLGVVHRDVKPANLFITSRTDGSDVLKVLDFGISKVQDAAQEDITHAHTLLGTPAYMSPEQMRTPKDVDGRTDIWSLGVVLYELLSGGRPFRGEAFSELCLQVVSDPVPQIPNADELPPGLNDIVMTCLVKDLEGRYQNVAELSAALAPFAADRDQAVSLVQRTSRSLQVPILPPDLITGSHISRNASLDSQQSRISHQSLVSHQSHISRQSQSHISRSSGGSHASHVSELSDADLISYDSHISHHSSPSVSSTGSGSTLGQGLGQVVAPKAPPKRRRVWWLAALVLLFMASVGVVVLFGSPKTGSAENSAAPTPSNQPPSAPADSAATDSSTDETTDNGTATVTDNGTAATTDNGTDEATDETTTASAKSADAGVGGDDSSGTADDGDGHSGEETTVAKNTDDPQGDSTTAKPKKKKKKKRKKPTDDGDDDESFLDSRN